jgi:hypothetical protein
MTVADIPVTGRVRIAWVTTIAAKAAPTTSELNAGLRLDTKVTAVEGFTPTTNEIDTSKVNDKFDGKAPGTGAFSNSSVTIAEDDTDNTIVDTMYDNSLDSGYLVMRLNVDADTAWADDDVVDVYPCIVGVPHPVDPGARNTILRHMFPLTINADPAYRAVVGGSV